VDAGGKQTLPDQGAAQSEHALLKLGEDIRGLLTVADSLGLAMVGIHLCSALEALQLAPPIEPQFRGPDQGNGSGL
jgi:hypothetical protein